MKHLKLKRGMSYSGRGVTATKAAPNVTVENDAQANELIATGYFEEVKAPNGGEVAPHLPPLFDDHLRQSEC